MSLASGLIPEPVEQIDQLLRSIADPPYELDAESRALKATLRAQRDELTGRRAARLAKSRAEAVLATVQQWSRHAKSSKLPLARSRYADLHHICEEAGELCTEIFELSRSHPELQPIVEAAVQEYENFVDWLAKNRPPAPSMLDLHLEMLRRRGLRPS
jgi:hypothetical protein